MPAEWLKEHRVVTDYTMRSAANTVTVVTCLIVPEEFGGKQTRVDCLNLGS